MERKHRIIVIGAGLAGLAAARSLQNDGHQVTVVEARDRIGGRIWTSKKWPDIPLDLGASWIHGLEENPLTKLAKEANARFIETSYDRNIIYRTEGLELTEEQEDRLDDLRSKIQRALKAAQDADEDTSIRQVIDQLQTKLKANPETRRFLNFILSSQIEQEYAGGVDQMSSAWFDDHVEFDGEDALFAEGFDQIIELLAEDLDIQKEQVVTHVDWSMTPVRVIAKSREFTADKVVVTLPLGVLKSGRVKFVPPLPESMKGAISKLEMGVLNKCYLRFPKVFWPKNVDWLEYVPEKHGEWVEWVSFARTMKLPILLGFNAAARGREIESWTDTQIVASAMQTLKKIFGDDLPQPEDYQITRWASDPYAFGSYSFNAIGSHPKLRHQLAKPLEHRLYFAGEATEEDYFGTAHGGYLSGIRVAEQIGQSQKNH